MMAELALLARSIDSAKPRSASPPPSKIVRSLNQKKSLRPTMGRRINAK